MAGLTLTCLSQSQNDRASGLDVYFREASEQRAHERGALDVKGPKQFLLTQPAIAT